MNKIETIEQFVDTITDIFARLSEMGDISLPCPAPQPWNNSSFQPIFEADRGGRSIVPDWRFSCNPIFNQPIGYMKFKGLRISVNVKDATMYGNNRSVEIYSADQLPAALASLISFRNEKLTACKHINHAFVANLGRCYNRYKCNDCGVTFEIDSGD